MLKSLWRRNSLSIVLLILFLFAFTGQIVTGWREYNSRNKDFKLPPVSLRHYLTTGKFIEVTFENLESEYLQLSCFLLFTVFLRQRGSGASKSLTRKEDVDKEPQPHQHAPWFVRQGGIWLRLYSNSLSLALIFLFILCFCLHAYGSLADFNREQRLRHLPTTDMTRYLAHSRLWFESFQNWQSEFFFSRDYGVVVCFSETKRCA